MSWNVLHIPPVTRASVRHKAVSHDRVPRERQSPRSIVGCTGAKLGDDVRRQKTNTWIFVTGKGPAREELSSLLLRVEVSVDPTTWVIAVDSAVQIEILDLNDCSDRNEVSESVSPNLPSIGEDQWPTRSNERRISVHRAMGERLVDGYPLRISCFGTFVMVFLGPGMRNSGYV